MPQKIWISKYALTGGIKECVADVGEDGKVFPGAPFASFTYFIVGKDAHLSRDEAVQAARAMAMKKATSLKKQITKLETMTF